MTTRTELRRAFGRDAVLSEAEAVEAMPFRDSACREWLRANGLVRSRPGLGRYVIWGDVLQALRDDQPEPDEEPRAASGYPRAVLRGQKP